MRFSIDELVDHLRMKIDQSSHRRKGRRIVHFIHIGKTGGSAIKYALKDHKICKDYVVYTHPHGFNLRDVPRGDAFIFFLRDPISRFVSGFYSRMRQGRPKYFSPWSPGEEKAFEQFETADSLAGALSSADPEVRDAARDAMCSIEHVKDSYLKWFESEEYFLSRLDDLFFVGYQDSLSADFEQLKRKLGLPDCVGLPSDGVIAHRSLGSEDKSLGEQSLENLRSWYKADFDFLAMTKKCKEGSLGESRVES